MRTSRVAIVTPALASANNGNWQTARRWARMLSARHRTQILPAWNGERADALIALHARRSAASIAAWKAARPEAPLVVVLTGTDLYRDIDIDADARASLEAADRLVVLNDLGSARLPASLRPKARVVLQSARSRKAPPKPRRHLRAVMVGHLRAEKSPETFIKAARLLTEAGDILLDHIGAPLDADLAALARATAAECPGYRWLGAQPHETTLRRIQRAHVLVHASRMEGGAHAVIEALRLGTPVLASRIDGNVGLLGRDYAGYFRWGNATQLSAMLVQCRASMLRGEGLLPRLTGQCRALSPRFDPGAEAAALEGVLAELL
jgi:putative glycosyltransferase (TIGR04348 family)